MVKKPRHVGIWWKSQKKLQYGENVTTWKNFKNIDIL